MPEHEPSPQLFFDTMNAYQRTAALKGAIDLDLFSQIGSSSRTADQIAQLCNVPQRGVRILCDFLTICGFLTKRDDRYALTPDTAMFLDRKSPAYVGGAADFLLSPMLVDSFKDVAATVRKGGTILSEGGSTGPEHPMWVQFAHAMTSLQMMPAQMIARKVAQDSAGPIKVLDIAAGHGIFGIAIAQQNPRATVTALDWAPVLKVATENAKRFGVADRFTTIAGSAFDVDFGGPFDVVLLTNFLHHFDEPTCVMLLKKIHSALSPAGKVMTLEFIPNEDRISPATAAAFSFMMLASTPSGDAYTFSQLDRMFRSAGFSHNEQQPLGTSPGQLIISKK
jgi:ubiquinone/menaquinone biosynthesis C-methylase UbiE